MKVNLDIKPLLQKYSFSQREVRLLRELALKTYVALAYEETVKLAKSQLNQTRNEYISGLEVTKVDQHVYMIILHGVLPNMLENGAVSFDQKPGFSRSEKAKKKKNGGWYLTIPFVYRTPSANPFSGEQGELLPRDIYDLIRNSPSTVKTLPSSEISTLSEGDVPSKYNPVSKLVELNNKAESFIPKSSFYADLVRKKNLQTGKSSYTTFRRVSDTSPAMSWVHPGFAPYRILDQAGTNIQSSEHVNATLSKTLQIFFDR